MVVISQTIFSAHFFQPEKLYFIEMIELNFYSQDSIWKYVDIGMSNGLTLT